MDIVAFLASVAFLALGASFGPGNLGWVHQMVVAPKPASVDSYWVVPHLADIVVVVDSTLAELPSEAFPAAVEHPSEA